MRGGSVVDIVLLIAFLMNYILNLLFIKKNKYGFLFTKLLLTTLLALFYYFHNDSTNMVVFIALLFCFFGDLFLEFSQKESCFISGVASFLMGHIFYIICFVQQASNGLPWWVFLILFLYVAYGFNFYMGLKVEDKRLKAALGVYSGVILLMSFSALLRINSVITSKFVLTFIGSLLFVASDSVLAHNMFNKKVKHADLWIMSTYGLAQLLIIMGI